MSDVNPCDQPCPKCGDDDISRDFKRKGKPFREPYDKDYQFLIDEKFASRKLFESPKARKDFILNHCRYCHYEWGSNPLGEKE